LVAFYVALRHRHHLLLRVAAAAPRFRGRLIAGAFSVIILTVQKKYPTQNMELPKP
jgi:hypothetical protein